jgi:serine/threonine protein kinase
VSTSLIGRKLGKYEITALIGKGGMATVYKGYQPDIDRYVAIKVLPPHPGQDEQFIERFRLEARTIARLQHPHILPLYDYGSQDDILYLVMALMDGGSLSERLRRRGAMSPAEVEAILNPVASALDYAHRQGYIHRDIKPDNILLDREGFAALADFGIVKMLETGSGLTATGGLMGTPAYMSPEQGQGLEVDSRSDVYSLGVVVFEMLAGKPPYQADTPMQLVFKQINAPIPDLSSVRSGLPAALDEVMHRALAKDPDMRYQTATALLNDFRRAIEGKPLPSTRASIRDAGSDTIVDPGAALSPASGGHSGGAPTPIIAHTPPPGSHSTPQPYTQTPAGMSSTPTAMQQPTIIQQSGLSPVIVAVGVIIILLLVAILAVIIITFSGQTPQAVPIPSVTPPPTAAPTRPPTAAPAGVSNFGRLSFGTSASPGDTVNLRVEGLRQPTSGTSYVAWLIPVEPDAAPLNLGELRVDSLGQGLLSFIDPEGRNLATLYRGVSISMEQMMDGAQPEGEIVYSGGMPVRVPQALTAILVASEDGFSGRSLLDGAITEVRIARQHAGLAAGSSTVGAMKTHAEHTINILRGTQLDLDGNGRSENPGRGVGVYFFLDRIDQELTAAAQAPGANIALQAQIELIRVCVANARAWSDRVIELEEVLLVADSVEAVESERIESTDLAQRVISGFDLNENGEVEPFEGECGLEQIPTYGIAVANMDLRAGALAVTAEGG